VNKWVALEGVHCMKFLLLLEMLSGNASNTAGKMQDFDVNCFGDAMWMMQQPTQG